MNYRSVFVLGFFIFLLIIFDASQQKFYIDTFNLSNSAVPLSKLVMNHFIRWAIWGASCIPFVYLIWKKIENTEQREKQHVEPFIGALIVPSLLVVLLLISVVSILMTGLPITGANLTEFGIFFFYQKGITFFMAYVGVALYLFSFAKSRQIDTQWLEIEGLREARDNEAINPRNSVPQISVKIGNRIKPILIQDIRWIQSDDYCVRIHTKTQTYCLRKSLKFLEKELAPYRFIRVHRGALLNLDFLDQIDFESATIKLQDNSELPLSKSGEQILRRKMREQSI